MKYFSIVVVATCLISQVSTGCGSSSNKDRAIQQGGIGGTAAGAGSGTGGAAAATAATGGSAATNGGSATSSAGSSAMGGNTGSGAAGASSTSGGAAGAGTGGSSSSAAAGNPGSGGSSATGTGPTGGNSTAGTRATGGNPGTAGATSTIASGGSSTGGRSSATGGTAAIGGNSAIVIDHTKVDASAIPLSYLDTARAFDVVFQHKSIGFDITEGLNALAAQNPTRYSVNIVGWPYWWTDEQGGHDGTPPPISWYATHDGIGSWENGTNGDAASKTTGFNALMRSGYGAVARVALMKFCFNEVWSGSGAATWDLYRPVITGLMRDYPNVTFVWATMPMAFVTNQDDSNDYGRPTYDFNNLLRAYVAANGGYLFDIADIERYANNGTASTDSAGYPALSLDWAVSASDTHLNAAGAARVANAWWHLMARIAGWRP